MLVIIYLIGLFLSVIYFWKDLEKHGHEDLMILLLPCSLLWPIVVPIFLLIHLVHRLAK